MRIRLAATLSLLLSTGAAAQELPVNRNTQVRSVSFRVRGGPVADGLAVQLATQGQGARGRLPRPVQALPFVGRPPNRPFNPFEVQRDKERIRRRYAQIGYPRAVVTYDVRRDRRTNVVDVTFRIETGAPLVVSSVAVAWDSLGPSPRGPGHGVLDPRGPTLAVKRGAPLNQGAVAATVAAIAEWYANRGYAFASVRPDVAVDSGRNRAAVAFRSTAGPRARIGSISVEGNRAVSGGAIRDLLVIRPGDWYSVSRAQSASRRLTLLDAVSRATLERVPGQTGDTVVDLLVRIRELPPRRLVGQAGYTTDGGVTGVVTWSHGNLFGGAQTLTADVTGQSGLLALGANADKFVRTSVTARVPIRGRADLTLSAGPYHEFRNDHRDRSIEVGAATTLLYQIGPLSSIALRHQLANRRIYEYRFGDISGGLDALELLRLDADGVLDSLGARIGTHTLSLSATLGNLDVPADPSNGLVVEPTLTVTVPGGLTSADYVTAAVRASGYRPVNQWLTAAVRVGAGKVLPYGKSVPATPDDGVRQLLRLRDVLFTAGGTADVRGWPTRLLGPKLPQFIVPANPDSVIQLTADRYSPLGGLNLAHGTFELRAPVPKLANSLTAHSFVDAGRVWTFDRRFGANGEDRYGVAKLFWSTGVGVNYLTPIGAVRAEVGYKLNPSILDLADPGDVARAISAGEPLESARRRNSHRYRFHIGIGRRL